MQFIDLKRQYASLKSEIDAGIQRVLEHGQYIMGPEIAELETQLAEYTGAQHCLTVSSGTDSLEIVLRALDIGPGDEVITVPFTWISTAEVIHLVGAKARFVDICYDDFNINVSQIEAAINDRTKAIMPVSLFGQMPDYSAINAIAEKYGLTVIEDAAQSFGATQNDRKSCNVTRVASTSFFPAKPFGCYGDGGAVFTSDAELNEKMTAIRNHGGLKREDHRYIGMNGRFDTVQAAVLLAKLPSFPDEVQARGEIGNRYSELLKGLCVTPEVCKGNTHVYAQYTIRSERRDDLVAYLRERGIPCAVYYGKCLHEQPAFGELGYKYGDFPESEKASKEVLSLPMHPFLTEEEQIKIAGEIRDFSEA